MKTLCVMLGCVLLISGCAELITTPIKVVGKTATTTIGVAGDVAAAGVKAGTKTAKSTGVKPEVVDAAILLAK